MFIQLTGRSNPTVVIRADRIDAIADEDFTAVSIMGSEGGFAVKETPEQIMEMIANVRN